MAGDRLTAVSCTSVSSCTAVGVSGNGSVEVPLAERRTGQSWKVQPVPVPRGATVVSLDAVSCTSSTSCFAVGGYRAPSGDQVTLAEAWNGTAWELQSTPDPAGAVGSDLSGVSCTSATACIAVGRSRTTSGAEPLAEEWDGTAWALSPAANPPTGKDGTLAAVSCTSSSRCVAVGSRVTRDRGELTLGEVWDGAMWTIQTTKNLYSSSFTRLSGVSCPSPTSCTAVGEGGTGVHTVAMAETIVAGAWKLKGVGEPNDESSFAAVSCTGPTACTGVGSTDSASPLAEVFERSGWQEESVPYPPGTTSNGLDGVSCVSKSTCIAVGSTATSDTSRTLAEIRVGTAWTIQTTPDPKPT